ncbi:MAG TPA: ankyrin repeat domain-containing protein [Polyangiaceae bacterium]|jgi:ankyrin repeat protein
MKPLPTAFLVLAGAAACASAPPPAPASPPPAAPAPPPSAPPDEATVDRFFEAVQGGKRDDVDHLLAASPALASASSRKGHSAFLVALFKQVGEGFLKPQDNPVLASILAHAPQLDAVEAAGAGDQARVETELRRDPGYVRRVHPIGWTPLHFAAFCNAVAVGEALLAHGADVNARAQNDFQNTPLQVALLTGQEGMVRLLLLRGADVNVRQGEGFIALHEAAQSGDVALVKLLLDAGSEVSVAGGKKHLSPLDVAIEAKRDEVVALLRARGAKETAGVASEAPKTR